MKLEGTLNLMKKVHYMEPWDENWVAGPDLPAIINVSMTDFRMTPAILIRYRKMKKIEILQQFVEMRSPRPPFRGTFFTSYTG